MTQLYRGARRSLLPTAIGGTEAPWEYCIITKQGAEVVAPELPERRTLSSKTFAIPSGGGYVSEVQNGRHYRPDGLRGQEAWRDVDLANPDDIRARYVLTRMPGIGYTYQSREPGAPAVTVQMLDVPRLPKPDVRDEGVLYYTDVDAQLDIYTKPLADRYGIFKVLKGPDAPRVFCFSWSASALPKKAVSNSAKQYTGAELDSALQAGIEVLALQFDQCALPPCVAWDANGNPVEVRRTIKGNTITEEVMVSDYAAWPVTVDTDVEERVGAGGDDGTWYYSAAGVFGTGDPQDYLGSSTYARHSFMRWTTVPVPAGAYIASAVVQLRAGGDFSATAVHVNLHFNAADSAVAPTSYAQAEALALTQALAWSNVGAWVQFTWYSTPDITALLQLILDRQGWQADNDIMLVVRDNGSSSSARRRYYTANYGTSSSPRLVVVWYESPPIYAELVAPSTDHDVATAPQVFQVRAYTDDESQARVRLQTDTAITFDTEGLVEVVSEYDDSGELHLLEHSFVGTNSWYWRARAEKVGEVSAWTGTRLLNVDTGGAVPTDMLPDPENPIPLNKQFAIIWSAKLNHVLTPVTNATLRLQVQRDVDSEFPSPETETSERVAGGARVSITMPVAAPGTYWVRFRTLADYGDNSAWIAYEVTVTDVSLFVGPVQWIPQIGPRSNRVFVRIADTTMVKTAEVAGISADAKVDHWIEVPAETTETEAQTAANDILAVRQARPPSITGPVALSVAVGFDRKVVVQWWEEDPDTGERVKREEYTLALGKKVHDIDNGVTTLYLGEYLPSPEELQARILAKLIRRP